MTGYLSLGARFKTPRGILLFTSLPAADKNGDFTGPIFQALCPLPGHIFRLRSKRQIMQAAGSTITHMEIIYIDSLFLLNLLVDYLLCLAAALFGAACSVAVYLPGLGFLAGPFFRLAMGLGMGLIAFYPERRPLRCTGVLLAVAAGFGGALWAVSLASGGDGVLTLSFKNLLLAFALCYAVLCLLFRCRAALAEKRKAMVRLAFLGRSAEFIALVDTGNTLTDPLTGAPVLVACPHALRTVLLENTELFSRSGPVELIELSAHIPELAGRLRLIPYSAVGSSGLLPVFRPDSLSVDGREDKELLVAVSQNAAGDGFEAII